MHRLNLFLSGVVFALAVAFSAKADTFTLTDSNKVSGEIVTFSAKGIIFKTDDGKYSEPVAWEKFSQDDLKKLEEKLPRAASFIKPLIVETIEEKRAKTAIEIKTNYETLGPPPPSRSVIGGLFGSALGIVILLLIYAANIYAGYEVAIFRSQQPALVCGVAAVLPVIGPVIFLSMPTRVAKTEDEWAGVEQTHAAEGEGAGQFIVPGEAPAEATPYPPREHDASAIPATQVFPRGQFTLNRRFFETKFPGFFGVVKRADKDMLLVVKSARGTYIADRIPRIAPNDIHLLVIRGGASEEITVPFTEIQEVQLKHKDAP